MIYLHLFNSYNDSMKSVYYLIAQIRKLRFKETRLTLSWSKESGFTQDFSTPKYYGFFENRWVYSIE